MESTRTFFERRLQTVFQVVPTMGATPIGLKLHAIQRPSPTKPAPLRDRLRKPPNDGFTLLFHGPLDPVLEQCIYALRPRDDWERRLETFCFLIPLGRASAPATMQYGAIFGEGSQLS